MGRRPNDDWDAEEESDATHDGDSDDGDTMPCPHCRREIYDDSERCPHCGEYLGGSDEPGTGKPLWVVVTVIVVLAAILLTWIF
jgi:hypothetical protein